MTSSEPPESARVVVLMLGDGLPPSLVADLLGEASDVLKLHGYTDLLLDGQTVTARPPVAETDHAHEGDDHA